MKRYEFQALVTMGGDGNGGSGVMLGSVPRPMVLRGRNDETGQSQIFTALVSWEDEAPFRPHGHQMLVTLRLAGDDVADYFHSGSRLDLWQGSDVGHGVVSRGLFV